MEDYQVINKIKKLQQIKPNKDWVIFTKREILQEEAEKIQAGNLLWNWLFRPGLKPILILPILLLLIVGINFQLSKSEDTPNISGLDESYPKTQDAQALVLALENLQTGVSEMIESFEGIEKPSTKDIMEVGPKLALSVKSGKSIVNEIKGLGPGEVLGDKVTELGDSLDNIANFYFEDYIEEELEKLETLNDKDLLPEFYQEDLMEVREYYQGNDYPNAFLKLIEISQSEKEIEM